MNPTLRPFQVHGVEWLASRRNALLADDPGVGKTPQVVCAIPAMTPTLAVAPSSIKGVWRNMFKVWRPDVRTVVLHRRDEFRYPEPGEAVIVSYDILPRMPSKAEAKLWIPPVGMNLIGDEATALKSNKTKRHESFAAIAKMALRSHGRVYLLSGTPVINHPYELWNMLKAGCLETEAFGSFGKFLWLFEGHQGRFGIVYGTPRPEVKDCLRKVMLRRTKREVLPELPPVSYQDIPVEIPEDVKLVCDKAVQALKDAGVDLEASLDLVDATAITGAEFDEVARARKSLAVAKVAALLELVEGYEESGEPLVVFSAHRAPIDVLAGRKGWAVITGDQGSEARTKAVLDFQEGRLLGIGATIQAGGMGITLTRASHAIFVDQAWTPAMNRQARDRLDRMGQKRGVLIIRMVAEHALDERVTAILDQKMNLINDVVDEGPVAVAANDFEETTTCQTN